MKQQGQPNDLVERIKATAFFEPVLPELESLLDPKTFIGRCPELVDKLIEQKVKPALESYADALKNAEVAELNV